MRSILGVVLLVSMVAVLPRARGQEKPSEKPQEKKETEEKSKPLIEVRVQLVLTEYDGEKKLASMPYTFLTVANDKYWRGSQGTSLRTGVRVPIEIEAKEEKFTYLDVGSNIDCGLRTDEEGRFEIHLVFERSAIYPNGTGEEKLEVSRPNGQPLIRSFKTSQDILLHDGQTLESMLSTDPLNGHVFRFSITINVLK